jgi:hypothetical protein
LRLVTVKFYLPVFTKKLALARDLQSYHKRNLLQRGINMNPRVLALGVVAALAATSVAAYAVPTNVMFNDITGNAGSIYWDGNGGNPASTEVATEFTATAGTIGSLMLELSANNPSDGKSVSVFIIPDSSAFESTGSVGSATAIAMINDSLLPQTPSAGSIWPAAATTVALTSAPTLSAGDYWIVLESASSSFDWWLANDQAYTGTAGLAGNNGGGTWGAGQPSPFLGYGAEVTVPEPGTIALLGLGLAGLGWARRRKVA